MTSQSAGNNLHTLTITQAADLIAQRQLSPRDLTSALINRAEALDPQLNAYLRPCFDQAMAQATQAEQDILANGPRTPLHGIPYGLKDVIDAAGMPTTGHSRVYANNVPTKDATVTAKLAQAGAVLLGKLSTHEGAHGGPSFDLAWPPARNPWNRDHFTGGSSSGSGAAVAAGFMPMALGTDTGGSIRNPAGLCGLVGLKPTYGLVSRHGVMPNSFSYDHVGPLTWTVEDCAISLQAIAGHDPADPASANQPIPDYRAWLAGSIKGLRIGVLRHAFEEDVKVPSPVHAALEQAIAVLASLGATISDARIRPMADYFDVKVVTAESEIFSVHERHLKDRPNDFGEDFLARILPAIMIRGTDYVASQRLRQVMLAEFDALYKDFDILLTGAPSLAPRLDAWHPLNFLRSRASFLNPANVSGGPALVQCIGFHNGLPISMQLIGRPFDDATVLRAAHAYERATPWRQTRPTLDAQAAFTPGLPPIPDPAPLTLSQSDQDELALLCRRAGLTKLSDRAFQHLCAAAPYMREILATMPRPTGFTNEPASVLTVKTSLQ
jgi:aspartyl-tRNA(Asn)/glutamyl-tRNA(Gln) amidotransferase subunit A